MTRLSPVEVHKEACESLAAYLDTAYRIGHPLAAMERSALIRQRETTAQKPFVETTPPFRTGNYLKDVKSPFIPALLNELFSTHVLGRRPLYVHQEHALKMAWNSDGTPNNIVVATGTGSGKTEAFLLPMLADIMSEAEAEWVDGPDRIPDCGYIQDKSWQHRRHAEHRPSAVRAVILYPMNALANDQAARLRRILSTDVAMSFVRSRLRNNLIYFGQYTSRAETPGHWSREGRVRDWERYRVEIYRDWASLTETERATGDWIRPDGPEMYCRWDMQEAPPDILITNYSMLEYMLLRPIERTVWSMTRKWLAESPSHILTLVLDEAHMYRGARGTEVAYLLRRLCDQLDVSNRQVRFVATSATLGEGSGAEEAVKVFAGQLFGAEPHSFEIIHTESENMGEEEDLSDMEHFRQVMVDFQKALERGTDIAAAARTLVTDMPVHPNCIDASAAAFSALKDNPIVRRMRRITARNATYWDDLCKQLWGRKVSKSEADLATSGLLGIGSYARPGGVEDKETPPLLPTRMHMVFRGIPGLWACIRPDCPAVDEPFRGSRPCGKLYSEPQLWCKCGARVLEVFTCRFCGLIFLGGIPDNPALEGDASLWPYEYDMEGLSREERIKRFRLLIAEEPRAERPVQFRSWATTRVVHRQDPSAAKFWKEEGRVKDGEQNPFPSICPRCYGRAYQRASGGSREVIEPLDTMGHQAFAVLCEEFFRLQPGHSYAARKPESTPERVWGNWQAGPQPPEPAESVNAGRKVITFADGRQHAARFAGDLSYSHRRDVFRQLMRLSLEEHSGKPTMVSTLHSDLLRLCVEYAVDPLDKPDRGSQLDYWELRRTNPPEMTRHAQDALWLLIRREITDRQLGLEALGVARWLIAPGGCTENLEKMPPFLGFSKAESPVLLTNVIRIIAAEGAVLPPNNDPYYWNQIPGGEDVHSRLLSRQTIPDGLRWSVKSKNRLTRYLGSLVTGRNTSLGDLMDSVWDTLLSGHLIHFIAANPDAWGLPITLLALASLPERIFVCDSCGFILAEAIDGVCIRCAGLCRQTTIQALDSSRPNYYRRSALKALSSSTPDPFPLHVREHTAQISVIDALERERHFKGKFRVSGETPDDPYRDRVDVLSVTTTMELGIDIGELCAVGLRNVPPAVANYQQRAGRAGRRSDGVAFVYTMSLHLSHDQYYFRHLTEMISGAVRFPELNLDNEEIAHRHVRAWLMDLFFRSFATTVGSNVLESWGDVSHLRSIGIDKIEAFLHNNRRRLLPRGMVMLPSSMPLEQWITDLPGEVEKAIQHHRDEAPLIDVLMEAQMLPTYGFPTDVVGMWTQQPNLGTRVSEPIQRDAGIALSEFAPGGEIIVDGYIHKSAGLFDPYGNDLAYKPHGWYYECRNCRHVDILQDAPEDAPAVLQRCRMCLAPTEPRRVNTPSGFRTHWGHQRPYRGGGREVVGHTSVARLLPGEVPETGSTILADRVRCHQRRGALLQVNTGEAGKGFQICQDCGLALDNVTAHSRPVWNHGSWHFPVCPGTGLHRIVLVHEFYSEVALLRINWCEGLFADPTSKPGKASLHSLGYSLLRASAVFLQVDPAELAMGVQPYRVVDEFGSHRIGGDIYIYDTLPGGAGYARAIDASLERIMRLARELLEDCPQSCETACYRCLLDYSNQRFHGLLDRRLAIDVLGYVIEGTVPSLSKETEGKLLERLQFFVAGNCSIQLMSDDIHGVFAVVTLGDTRRVIVKPVHTLSTGNQDCRLALVSQTGVVSFIPASAIELERQPFGVWQQLVEEAR